MEFSDLSAADAERYRACIEADGPIRLVELASLVEADGVDLGQFDASLESLVPLWSWFVGFAKADFPGVPADARPRREAVEQGYRDRSRDDYASEFLMHYLYEVSKGLIWDVAWVVNKEKRTGSFNRTEMHRVSDDAVKLPFQLDAFCSSHVKVLMDDRPESEKSTRFLNSDEPDWLLSKSLATIFNLGARTTERILATPRSGVSILEGLGDPGPAQPPLVFPSVPDADAAAEVEEERFGDELMLAHPKAIPDNLERARALDAVLVAETLNALGCITYDGGPVTVAAILEEEFAEFLRGDDAAMFATESLRGKLRAVHVDAINPTKEQWDQITTALQDLATKLGARLARSEEFYPPDAN